MTATIPRAKHCATLLTAALAARGMSIRQLALQAALNYSYVQRACTGEVVASYTALGSLARVLDTPLQPLLRAAAQDRIIRFAHEQNTVVAQIEDILTSTTTPDRELAACA